MFLADGLKAIACLKDGQLLLYAADTRYLAYVGVYSSSNYNENSLIEEAAVNKRNRSEVSAFTFDTGDLDTVYIKLGDFASNITKIALTG